MGSIHLIYSTKIEEGLIKPKKRKVTRKDKYMQYYEGFEKTRAKLDRCSSMLLGFFIEQADEQNRVYVNKVTKDEFVEYSGKILGMDKAYSLTSINNALSKLRKGFVLIQTYSAGVNYINPALVFKGSQDDRMSVIKKINSEMIKVNANLKIGGDTLLDETE